MAALAELTRAVFKFHDRTMRGIEVHVTLVVSAVMLTGVMRPHAALASHRSTVATTRERTTGIVPQSDSLVVELRILRLASVTGSTLISSGIPFRSGALHSADLPRVRIEVEGSEVSAYVAPVAQWPDGSLRSVLIQFEWTLGPSGSVLARLVVGSAKPVARRPGRVGQLGLPDAAALPSRAEYLVQTALAGPTLTTSVTRTLGGAFAKYDTDFKRLSDRHWKARADAWEENYYDRSLVYYVAWMRSGDPEYWRRGTMIALNYRRQYLERNNYGTTPHWAQVAGLELHYLLTGDTLSRRAVAGAYAWGLLTFATARYGPLAAIENPQSEYMENRIQARVLQAALSAYRMGASFVRSDGYGGELSPATWPTRLRDLLNKILSVQRADGSYPWVQICGGQLNYMVGMLNDVLIEYYRDFEADPRIPAAVEKANEYLWTKQWLPADQAFKYASVNCSPNQFGRSVGGMTPAGDLNGLIIGSFGWLYQQTGDPKWRTRGDAIFAGLVAPRWVSNYTGSKQFNQAYTASFRYLAYRAKRS
jgi:hypothetical protein